MTNVSYNLDAGFLLGTTHTYAGCTKYQKVQQGKKLVDTVAPGSYTNQPGCVGTVYVIFHAEVGVPDPNFGP